MLKIIRYILILLIGSFSGSIVEEVWCLIKNKRFERRQSLVYGPLIPIYGLAALFIIIVLDKIGYEMWKIFLIGFLIAAIVEYISSFFQEKIFHTKSWDYSDMKFNLHGRINFNYLLGFGLVAILFVKDINTIINILINTVDYKILLITTIVLTTGFVFDIAISYLACYRQKNRREGKKARNKLDKILDIRFNDERLKKIYPNSSIVINN